MIMTPKILQIDKNLLNYRDDIDLRVNNLNRKLSQLLAPGQSLADFANGHRFFGFHQTEDGWFYREWAPAAQEMFLTGDFCGWDRYRHPMTR